jgi:hypothetical protein
VSKAVWLVVQVVPVVVRLDPDIEPAGGAADGMRFDLR